MTTPSKKNKKKNRIPESDFKLGAPRSIGSDAAVAVARKKNALKNKEILHLCPECSGSKMCVRCGGRGEVKIPELSGDAGDIWYQKLRDAIESKPPGWNLLMAERDIIVIRDPKCISDNGTIDTIVPIGASDLTRNLGEIIAYETASASFGSDLSEILEGKDETKKTGGK